MSFIETDRLLLRTWMVPGDVEDARAIFSDAEVMRFIPRAPVPPDEIAAYLDRLNAITEHDPGLGLWPIVDKESGKVVGDCGLLHVPDSPDVEIAWHLRRDAWGRGYVAEAARAVLDYGFTQLRVPRIYALVDPMNARSIAVTNRLGMRFDRVVRAYHRDLLRYVAKPG
jgi:RimJ/RimL family protein N-acetyltransferase